MVIAEDFSKIEKSKSKALPQFQFKEAPVLNQEFLLKYNSEETYMEHYLGIPVKKGLFKSPLRRDNNPTCAFYRNKNGALIFKDFSGRFSGNFLDVVMEKYHVSYYKALRIVANDFNLWEFPNLEKHSSLIPKYTNTSFKATESADICVTIKEFTYNELKWWAQYGITMDILKRFNVFSCQAVFLNGNLLSFNSSNNQLCFGYYKASSDKNKQYWKIYYPGRHNMRFITNFKKTMLQGSHLLPKSGDLCIITKSQKDCMSLARCGIYAISPQSENVFLSKFQFESLSKRFKHIILLWDNDYAGISNANKIRKQYPSVEVFFIKKYISKDISDLCKLHGLKALLEAGEELKALGYNNKYFHHFNNAKYLNGNTNRES